MSSRDLLSLTSDETDIDEHLREDGEMMSRFIWQIYGIITISGLAVVLVSEYRT